VSPTAEVLLGIIAAAVAVMAVVQVGAIIAGLRIARRVEKLAGDLETSVKPLIGHLTTLSQEATRAASLATAQVERFDRLVTDMTVKVDQTLATAQHFVSGPAREGRALVAGIRAAVSALQGLRESSRRRSASRSRSLEDDEESLFIG
jgi:hypothetical protein